MGTDRGRGGFRQLNPYNVNIKGQIDINGVTFKLKYSPSNFLQNSSLAFKQVTNVNARHSNRIYEDAQNYYLNHLQGTSVFADPRQRTPSPQARYQQNRAA